MPSSQAVGPTVKDLALRLGVKPTVRVGVRMLVTELEEFTRWVKQGRRTGTLSIDYSQGTATWVSWEEQS